MLKNNISQRYYALVPNRSQKKDDVLDVTSWRIASFSSFRELKYSISLFLVSKKALCIYIVKTTIYDICLKLCNIFGMQFICSTYTSHICKIAVIFWTSLKISINESVLPLNQMVGSFYSESDMLWWGICVYWRPVLNHLLVQTKKYNSVYMFFLR